MLNLKNLCSFGMIVILEGIKEWEIEKSKKRHSTLQFQMSSELNLKGKSTQDTRPIGLLQCCKGAIGKLRVKRHANDTPLLVSLARLSFFAFAQANRLIYV